jgi:hypothetical protein
MRICRSRDRLATELLWTGGLSATSRSQRGRMLLTVTQRARSNLRRVAYSNEVSRNFPMALGRKTGGRTAGTPNRRTAEVAARLEELDCDPIEGMARLAMDQANPPELRGRMYAELAQYIAPKRKALDLGAHPGQKVLINLATGRNPVPPADAAVESTAE